MEMLTELGVTVAGADWLGPCQVFPLTGKVEKNLKVFAHREGGCWDAEAAVLKVAVVVGVVVVEPSVAVESSSHHRQVTAEIDDAAAPFLQAVDHLQLQTEELELDIAGWVAVGQEIEYFAWVSQGQWYHCCWVMATLHLPQLVVGLFFAC